ncbi:peptidyl-prolyl cis-trans isomerase FKBP4-like isoform X2 [Mizuhopecten yessoensis]|uniref:peptidylprolyl isomerase n=1 Tax=Mizuhopecten yessoensis TaxID=6573 RepID=A0A210R248_MIZYE|nr:peptidyl-prolyl cis-trans isomerase FKBP4-like isoform X2 [Mizuhopecten yessoensis]OWF54975.1 Peptidyl-prolyl cis-trans isomerase FKBP4 [Mizuhopecten yessoensis]
MDTKHENIDITPSKDGGVLKEILREGTGEDKPLAGDKVLVHYVGTLEDGTEFDSSRGRGDKFEFDLGKGSVIKSWDLGVATMKKGEICRLTCRGDYAYGENGSPPKIPANATLIFEVELFEWKGEDISEKKDGSVIRHLVQTGEGYQTPNDEASVKVHYVGRCGMTVFDDQQVEFILGEGDDAGVIEGVEVAIKQMKKKEKSRLEIQPSMAYGEAGNSKFNIPPNTPLQFDVELLSFEKAKESWEMDANEKLEQAEIKKAKGTSYFKAEKYKMAVKFYSAVVSLLDKATGMDSEEDSARKTSLLLAAFLNLAMCYLKLDDAHEAQGQCDKALEQDSKNVKALFRRGQALQSKGDYDLAKKDFESVVELDPQNKAAKNQITRCMQKIKEFKEKEKKMYAGMFQKFAEIDSKKKEIPLDEGKDLEKSDDLEKSTEEENQEPQTGDQPVEAS